MSTIASSSSYYVSALARYQEAQKQVNEIEAFLSTAQGTPQEQSVIPHYHRCIIAQQTLAQLHTVTSVVDRSDVAVNSIDIHWQQLHQDVLQLVQKVQGLALENRLASMLFVIYQAQSSICLRMVTRLLPEKTIASHMYTKWLQTRPPEPPTRITPSIRRKKSYEDFSKVVIGQRKGLVVKPWPRK
ncbi:MAG: hypothetical protein RL235_34 [Chlamydiota bacterium]